MKLFKLLNEGFWPALERLSEGVESFCCDNQSEAIHLEWLMASPTLLIAVPRKFYSYWTPLSSKNLKVFKTLQILNIES